MAEEKIEQKEEKKARVPRRNMNKRVQNQKQETTRRIPRKTTKEEKAETSENTKNVKNTRNTRKPREKREKKIQENTESKELVVRGENSIAERKTTRRENIFKKPKLKIIPLGGLHEVGKNITVFEYDDEIIVVDCGLSFPEDDMLGVVEATNNLLTSNILNLFIIQTIGIIIISIVQ